MGFGKASVRSGVGSEFVDLITIIIIFVFFIFQPVTGAV